MVKYNFLQITKLLEKLFKIGFKDEKSIIIIHRYNNYFGIKKSN